MFIFQYNRGEYYKSVPEMKEWLVDKNIIDEYGSEVSHADFWNLVEEKQALGNHIEEYGTDDERDFMVGPYTFTDCDFS
jgi:hypothetical protein